MSYTIIIKRQAKKKLLSLPRKDRVRITEKIELLGYDHEHPSLDVKKLTEEPYFRLRVGDWRIIFDKEDEIKIISVKKIDSRGGIYK